MRTRATDGPRVGRIIAAVLGGLLALWLLSGDRDPSAAEFVVSCVVDHHDTWDSKGVQFLELRCGNEHGALTVSVDKDLPITHWLVAHNKQRISVALGAKE